MEFLKYFVFEIIYKTFPLLNTQKYPQISEIQIDEYANRPKNEPIRVQ